MNTSVLYNRLGDDDNLVSGPTEISDERFEEVSCCLKTTAYYDDTNDVSTTYLGTYHAGDKPRVFNFENHIPMDGRGIARANLMYQTPLKFFLIQVPLGVICPIPITKLPKHCRNYLNLLPPVQGSR